MGNLRVHDRSQRGQLSDWQLFGHYIWPLNGRY